MPMHQAHSFVSDVSCGDCVGVGPPWHQQLLRRRKQWVLALRPGHQPSILQKDFYNKVTWRLIPIRPGIKKPTLPQNQQKLLRHFYKLHTTPEYSERGKKNSVHMIALCTYYATTHIYFG